MKALRGGISVAAIVIAAGHLWWPTIAIDAITLTLVAIALIPWLGPLFKSVELPGGLKIEFRELERVRTEAENVGLIPRGAMVGIGAAYPFELVASEDPNLALAGLRIEIERRLKRLAETRHVAVRNSTGVGYLIRSLDEAQVLRPQERSVLDDLIGLLNRAVHGADVDARAASWALEIGPQLLGSLDRRIQAAEGLQGDAGQAG